MKLPKAESSSTSTEDLLQPGHDVKERWRVISKLGSGGFGEIYKASDKATGDNVAIKVEKPTKQFLKIEVAVLKALQGSENFSRFLHSGKSSSYNYLVMELHGPSLAEIRRRHPKGFTLSTTLRVGKTILNTLTFLHGAGFVHRDLKPANFVVGINEPKKIFLIDFGMTKKIRTNCGELKPPKKNPGFRGTVRYASLNAHNNIDLGYHDDLWSFFYMLVEFIHGSLPWKGLKDHEAVRNMKKDCNVRSLIKAFPQEFEIFINHITDLVYEDTPDYVLLNNAFLSCMKTRGVKEGDPYDWQESGEALHKCSIEPKTVSEDFIILKASGSLNSDNVDCIKEKAAVKAGLCDRRNTQKDPEENNGSKLENAVIYADDCMNFLQISNCDIVSKNSQNCQNQLKPPNRNTHQVSLEKKNILHVSNPKSHSNIISSSQYAIADGTTSLPQLTIGEEAGLTSVSKIHSVDNSKNIDSKLDKKALFETEHNLKEKKFNLKNMFNCSSLFCLKEKNNRSKHTPQLEWQSSGTNGYPFLNACEKRRRPVRRSISHPAKTPPNLRVRRPTVKGDVPNFFHLGNLFLDSQTPKGLPRCWSCPTISLHIRSHLQPPLKQQASFDESVYEVDVMRNVAAKQTSVESIFSSDERRTSLPHISATDTQSEEVMKSSSMLLDGVIKEEHVANPSGTDFLKFVKNGSVLGGSVSPSFKSNIYLNFCTKNSVKEECIKKDSRTHYPNNNKLQRSLSMPRNKWYETGSSFHDPETSSMLKYRASSKVSDKHHSDHIYQKNNLNTHAKNVALKSAPLNKPDVNAALTYSSVCFSLNNLISFNDEENNEVFNKLIKNINPLEKSSSLSSTDFIREYIGIHNNNVNLSHGDERFKKVFKEINEKNSTFNDNKCTNSVAPQKKEMFCSPSETDFNGSNISVSKENICFSSKNNNQKCEESIGQRRCRANPDSKYAKDESELKLNFARRRQRPKSMIALTPNTSNSYKEFIDTNNSFHCPDVRNVHSIHQNDLKMLNFDNDLNLQQNANIKGSRLPVFYQRQVVYETSTNELPNSPPSNLPNNYCLPSRSVRYHIISDKKEICMY